MSKLAVFSLSTGRCGTQWFSSSLSRVYGDLALVDHEKFQLRYHPRENFQRYHSKDLARVHDDVMTHVLNIERTLRSKHYIETGWPCYGLVPTMREHFGDKFRLVHLFRHPERVAASCVTHRFYQRGHWTNTMCLFPGDVGICDDSLDETRWKALSSFEQNLFRVIETNEYAFRLATLYGSCVSARVKFENVFSSNADQELKALCDFMCLPWRPAFGLETRKPTDKFRQFIEEPVYEKSGHVFKTLHGQLAALGYEGPYIPTNKDIKRYQGTFLLRQKKFMYLRVHGIVFWLSAVVRGFSLSAWWRRFLHKFHGCAL